VIEKLLPASVESAEVFGDVTDPVRFPEAALFPEEEAAIARAVDKRRREFTTVRACARRALGKLGVAPVPLVPGERGAPQWPDGVVGSMTHCDGYRACVVARDHDVVTIGIDAEPNAPLPKGVLNIVSLPAEKAMLSDLAVAEPPGPHWDRMLFCAKEAVYKAWFPLTHKWLDFSEARIEISPDGTFTAELLVPGPTVHGTQLPGFAGRWLTHDGFILTAITHTAITNTVITDAVIHH
jgi:4'-phosphopantetheinyl transferase EntD